jgi:hypothetical protein
MCNCSAKKAGKIIGTFAGITTLFSIIVMIIAAVTLQYRIDPETMQKCPNSKGAYTTTCGTKRRLGEVHNLQTIPSVSFPSWSTAAETAAYFEDAMQATIQSMESHKKANVETKAPETKEKNTRERSLRLFEQLLGKEKKAGKARLLAAQNSDDCTTANDGTCDDPTKQAYMGYSRRRGATDCLPNQDTTDCGELLEGSVCEAGKCCCKCGSSDADAVDTTTYAGEDEYDCLYGTSECRSASTECASATSVDTRYIEKAITPTCINTQDVSGAGYKTRHSCYSFKINGESTMVDETGTCAGSRCTDEECCIEDDGSGYGGYGGYGSRDGCKKCCGVDKTTACEGTDGTTASINDYLMQFKELINYGSLACIAGVLPALAGALGKMKDHNCVGNTCGVLSLFSTTILSVGATGFVAVYMVGIGALIHLGCSSIQTLYADYETDSTCNEECLAAQKHLVEAICNLGKGFGATGMLMFLSTALG